MAEKSVPDFYVYTVKERSHGQDPFWLRVGAAWANKDGAGFNVQLDALPLDGRLVLRVPKAEEAKEEETKPTPTKRK